MKFRSRLFCFQFGVGLILFAISLAVGWPWIPIALEIERQYDKLEGLQLVPLFGLPGSCLVYLCSYNFVPNRIIRYSVYFLTALVALISIFCVSLWGLVV